MWAERHIFEYFFISKCCDCYNCILHIWNPKFRGIELHRCNFNQQKTTHLIILTLYFSGSRNIESNYSAASAKNIALVNYYVDVSHRTTCLELELHILRWMFSGTKECYRRKKYWSQIYHICIYNILISVCICVNGVPKIAVNNEKICL